MKLTKIKLWHVLVSMLLGVGVSLAATYPAVYRLKTTRAEEFKEIQHLNEILKQAVLNRDFATMQSILSDDFELYTPTRGVFDKQTWIKNIQKNAIRYESLRELKQAELQGTQFTTYPEISGTFFGDSGAWQVQSTISTVEYGDTTKIKRIVLKRTQGE